jgi:hypothetical protein
MLRSLLLAFVLVCSRASGAPITFIYHSVGGGTLDGVPFAASNFTITARGDTSNRYSFEGALVIDHDSTHIVIDGVGAFDFVSGLRTFLSGELVGFGREYTGEFTSGDLVYAPFNSDLAAWDMTTSFGAISGEGTLFQWDSDPPVATNGGVLIFADATPTVTFQALVVPEPHVAELALAGLAVAGGARGLRRAILLASPFA